MNGNRLRGEEGKGEEGRERQLSSQVIIVSQTSKTCELIIGFMRQDLSM